MGEKIEKQKRLDMKKQQDELDKQMQLKEKENQKLLKQKWNEQEALKKSSKKPKDKEREKIEETTIRIIEYPEPSKDDLDRTEKSEKVDPLLMEFADSVSTDILRDAK